MKRIAILATLLLAACAPKTDLRTGLYSVRMVRSEIKRAPEATYLDGQEGNYKWNYTTGLELRSFLAVSRAYDIPEFDAYVRAWYDGVLDKGGQIGGKYDLEKYNLDHICPARTLIGLYQATPDLRYAAAIETARKQLEGQPRTEAGAFWHKKAYPYQVWLDGLYMAEPFYAVYAAITHRDELFDDVVTQFKVAAEKTYDPATGLYRHAWDESRQMFWADPVTGQSAHCWGRALGWYTMALVEVLPFFPKDHPGKAELQGILEGILATLPKYADPETGMWYQVLDSPHVVPGPGQPGPGRELPGGHLLRDVHLRLSAVRPRRLCGARFRRSEGPLRGPREEVHPRGQGRHPESHRLLRRRRPRRQGEPQRHLRVLYQREDHRE